MSICAVNVITSISRLAVNVEAKRLRVSHTVKSTHINTGLADDFFYPVYWFSLQLEKIKMNEKVNLLQ